MAIVVEKFNDFKFALVNGSKALYAKVKPIIQSTQETADKILGKILYTNPVSKKYQVKIIPTCAENYLGKLTFDTSCPLSKTVADTNLDVIIVKKVFKKLVEQCD